MHQLKLRIDTCHHGKTVKQILYGYWKLSTRQIVILKKSRGIRVNGEVCTVRRELLEGDLVTADLPETEKSHILPQKGDLSILFEDAFLLAVNKNAGMATHPTPYDPTGTLANLVCGYLGEEFVFRAANRLDKATTGIVLIAKDRYTAEGLNRQLRENLVRKEYHAVCCGSLTEKGEIETFLRKKTPTGITYEIAPEGKLAKTRYTPVKPHPKGTLVQLQPITGRTHQLRIHMSSIGHPIYGDFLYGTEDPAVGLLLHCSGISFLHPVTHQECTLHAPLPQTFAP